MDRIMALRAKGIEKHVPSTCGSRHAEVFADIICQKGVLDEPMLAVRTFGLGNIPTLLSFIPTMLQAFKRGKVPKIGIFHRAIPSIRSIQRLCKKMKELK